MAGTGIRNQHLVGDYLMQDDESGLTEYRSNMVKLWDGTWRHKRNFERRQPQEFVQARNDPKALRHIRPDEPIRVLATANNCIGATSIVRPNGPASHLFQYDEALLTEEHKLPVAGPFNGNAVLDESGDCIITEGI